MDGQQVQTSSYKISQSQGCDVRMVTRANNAVLDILKLLRE